jgi:hypothetical protein
MAARGEREPRFGVGRSGIGAAQAACADEQAPLRETSVPRELTAQERRLLDFLLAEPFPGHEALARQAQTTRTGGSSCGCGCPSFSLEPDRALSRADVKERVPVEAHGPDAAGNPVGVLLFVDDGYLSEVEVYSLGADGFAGLPDPSGLKRC